MSERRKAKPAVVLRVPSGTEFLATIRDMWRIYHRVFSDAYELPSGRDRTP